MRSFSLSILFILLTVQCFAQKKLVFTHAQTHKTIELNVGNRAAFTYKGYMQQHEFIKEIITNITDSTVTLGFTYYPSLPPSITKPGKHPKLVYKVVRIADITGFRKMGVGRLLAKSAVSIGSIIGSYYLLRGIYNSNIGAGSSIALSMGVGIGIYGLNEMLFPENIKYYLEDGWQVSVANVYR